MRSRHPHYDVDVITAERWEQRQDHIETYPKWLQSLLYFWNAGRCPFFHQWDDSAGATRICNRCGHVQTMSHL